MAGNPTGAMGLCDYLEPGWVSRLGVPIVNLPGCPVQPDNITETLLHLALHVAGVEPMLELDEQGRPKWLFERTVHEGCGRAGFAEQGSSRPAGRPPGCLVKIGCKGPVAKCNVPIRGWTAGVGAAPTSADLHRLHDAGLPGPLPAVHGAEPDGPGRGQDEPVLLRAGDPAPAAASDGGTIGRMPTRVVFRCDFCGELPDPLTQLGARAPDPRAAPSASIWRSRRAAGWSGWAAGRWGRAATRAPSTAATSPPTCASTTARSPPTRGSARRIRPRGAPPTPSARSATGASSSVPWQAAAWDEGPGCGGGLDER